MCTLHVESIYVRTYVPRTQTHTQLDAYPGTHIHIPPLKTLMWYLKVHTTCRVPWPQYVLVMFYQSSGDELRPPAHDID